MNGVSSIKLSDLKKAKYVEKRQTTSTNIPEPVMNAERLKGFEGEQ